MKKILSLILASLLVLSASGCLADREQEELEPSASSESRGEPEPSSLPEPEPRPEPKPEREKEVLEPEDNLEILALEDWQTILETFAEKMFLSCPLEELEAMGITLSYSNVQPVKGEMARFLEGESRNMWGPREDYTLPSVSPSIRFLFDLTITTSQGKEQTFPLSGVGEDFTNYIVNIRPIWGGVGIIDDNTLVLHTFKDALFLNLDLEDTGFSLDFGALPGEDASLCEVRYHSQAGYVAPAFIDDKEYVAQFREDGSFVAAHPLPENEIWGDGFSPSYYPMYFRVLEFIQLDQPAMLFTDRGVSSSNLYITRLDDFSTLQYNSVFEIWNPDDYTSDYVYREGDYDVQVLTAFADSTYHIVSRLFHNGQQTGYARFEAEGVRYDLGFITSGGELQLNGSGQKLEYYSPSAGQTLTIDFAAHTGSLVYTIEKDQVSQVMATSPSGRYQVVFANQSGMGDAYWGNMALYDTQEEAFAFIGMSGSGDITESSRFVDDTAFYFKPDPLKIDFYRTADLSLYREVTLQYNAETEQRMENPQWFSYNTIYDPDTDRFYTAFIDDVEYEGGWEELDGTTYKIAVFDGNGSHIQTLPTTLQGNNGALYTRHCPEMSVSGNVLTIDGVEVSLS